MTVAPIYSAIPLVRVAVRTALLALSGGAGVYWLQAPETAAKPFIVFHSQDAGGRGEPKLSRLGWSGLITVKAIADTAGAAEALMAAVAPAMDGLTAPVGYDMTVVYDRPVVLPPFNGTSQAAHMWRVYLERE